jgi:S-adenosylmethionine hydrolase
MRSPTITFLSDFGLADPYVGVCHAVIASIAPRVQVVDLLHTVPALNVRRGATALADCVGVAPAAVHLAVIDPDPVARPGIVVCAGEAHLVGPDNGLLLPAADVLGGPTVAYALDDPSWHRTPVSPVFRGRDVFAPAAAHLASGVSAAALGQRIDVNALHRLSAVDATIGHRRIAAPVRNVDHYGNVQLPVTADDLHAAGLDHRQPVRVVTSKGEVEVRRVDSFSDLAAGELGIVEDSFGWLAIVAGGTDAARSLGITRSDDVRLGDD